MTTIVWDGRTLAADRFSHSDGNAICDRARKIAVLSPTTAVAGAGYVAVALQLKTWFASVLEECHGVLPDEGLATFSHPLNTQDNEDYATLLIVNCRRLYHTDTATRGAIERVVPPKYAIGSGRAYALGAMAVGADARGAVRAANKVMYAKSGGVNYWVHGMPAAR